MTDTEIRMYALERAMELVEFDGDFSPIRKLAREIECFIRNMTMSSEEFEND